MTMMNIKICYNLHIVVYIFMTVPTTDFNQVKEGWYDVDDHDKDYNKGDDDLMIMMMTMHKDYDKGDDVDCTLVPSEKQVRGISSQHNNQLKPPLIGNFPL